MKAGGGDMLKSLMLSLLQTKLMIFKPWSHQISLPQGLVLGEHQVLSTMWEFHTPAIKKMRVEHTGKRREDTGGRPWWVSINPQCLRPEETIKADSLEKPSHAISPCESRSTLRDYSLALRQTPANPVTSCWCTSKVLAGQSVLLKRLQVMMNSPFPPHNQGIAWFASGSYFTGVPKMYYTNGPGFRSCITDISIQRERLCHHLQLKLLFLQTSVPSAWDRSHPRLELVKVTCPCAAWTPDSILRSCGEPPHASWHLHTSQKSQNPWMVWVGKDIKDHRFPTPLPWAGNLLPDWKWGKRHKNLLQWSSLTQSILWLWSGGGNKPWAK